MSKYVRLLVVAFIVALLLGAVLTSAASAWGPHPWYPSWGGYYPAYWGGYNPYWGGGYPYYGGYGYGYTSYTTYYTSYWYGGGPYWGGGWYW
jgi:hypothetical protein